MLKKYISSNKNIYLRELMDIDVTQSYVDWLNNKEINQYLESRIVTHSLGTVKHYVKDLFESSDNMLFGVFDNSTDKHIGNIKLGNIDVFHRKADVGLIIGEKNYWGQGVATEMIKMISKIAKIKFSLNKLYAGAYSVNIGSIRAFIKAGWGQEGIQKKQSKFNDLFVDNIIMGKIL
jgi:[ribosomal protein S5]-alanine N-acetyltransferase